MTPRHLIEPGRLAGASILRAQADERLVDMTRAGQDRAFEALVARYRAPLHRFCSRSLSHGRAEDVVQQTFIKAYAAMKADDAALDFKPWLYRIARNTSIDALRQSGWSDEVLAPDGGASEGPEGAVERRQQLAGLVAAVRALPERQRDAVVLRELEGRSYEDIATRLGVTDGAVRQLLHRARSSIRAMTTSLTPIDLLYRLAARMPGAPPTPSRLAELTAGAGVAATVPKVVTAVLVTGAIAGGVADPPAVLEGADKATVAEAPERRDGRPAVVDLGGEPGRQRSRATRARAGDGPRRGPGRRGSGGETSDHGNTRARDRGSDRGERDDRRAGGSEVAEVERVERVSQTERSGEVTSEAMHEARDESSGPGERSSSGDDDEEAEGGDRAGSSRDDDGGHDADHNDDEDRSGSDSGRG